MTDAKTVEKMIKQAVERISKYPSATVFVKLERAKTKAGKLAPTDSQAKLLRYIRTHGWISFEETLGMDWRFLGGLFTRGLVVWASMGGMRGVAPSKQEE